MALAGHLLDIFSCLSLVIHRQVTQDDHIDINLDKSAGSELAILPIRVKSRMQSRIQHPLTAWTALPRLRTPGVLMATPDAQLEKPENEAPNIQNINQLLAKRRRKSYPKACYPCRCRKIRCDHMNPCGNCLKHEQPKLCVYLDQNGQVRKQQDSPSSRASNALTKERVAALAGLEHRMQTIAEEVVRRLGSLGGGILQESAKQPQTDEGSAIDTHSPTEAPWCQQMSPGDEPPATVGADDTGASVHIGAESLASILIDTLKSAHSMADSPQSSDGTGLSRYSAHETMKLLYMTDTGSTHPFTSLWKPGATVEDICLALPDNETFEQYVTSVALRFTSS